MATKDELIRVLRQSFPDLVDGLQTVPGTNRIMGFVASDHFIGSDHKERQDKLWAVIDRHYAKSAQRLFGPITTMTLEEATVHQSEEND